MKKRNFKTYLATAPGIGSLRIVARTVREAESMARRLLGDERIYRVPEDLADMNKIVDEIFNPGSRYAGPLEVRKESRSTPARAHRR
jgi:hypothetical protein